MPVIAVSGLSFRAVRWSLCVVRLLVGACCVLCVGCCLLPAVHGLLFVAGSMLAGAGCSLFVVRRVLRFAVVCDVWHVLFVV